jgi:hypothetical protein
MPPFFFSFLTVEEIDIGTVTELINFHKVILVDEVKPFQGL